LNLPIMLIYRVYTKEYLGLCGLYGYVSTRRRLYPTSDKSATVKSRIVRAKVVSSPCRVTAPLFKRRLPYTKLSVFCSLRRAIRWLQFSGLSGDNLDVILHLTTTFGGGITSSRRLGAFVKGRVLDGRVCQARMSKVAERLSRTFLKICKTCQS
jgi:hypothetical protein